MQSEHKNLIVPIVVGILLISSVSALSFRQSQDVDIKVVCINAGYCTDVSVCNVSVFSPSEVALLDGITATRAANLAFHNFTLNSSLTEQLGEYRVGGFCKDGSVTQLIDFTFDVTANGEPFQDFPTQFVIIIFGVIFIGLGLFAEKLRIFKHLGSIVIMIMGVITLYPGYSFINWTTLAGLSLGTILIGLGFYFLIEDSFSRNNQVEYFNQGGEH